MKKIDLMPTLGKSREEVASYLVSQGVGAPDDVAAAEELPPTPNGEWFCDRCSIIVRQVRCRICGKTKREKS